MEKAHFTRFIFLVLSFGLLWPAACRSSHTSAFINDIELESKSDALFLPYVEEGFLSGSVLIAGNGKILLAKGYGYSDEDKHIQNTPKTKFRICSMTKIFTGIAVLQLQERMMLDINDPVGKYVEGMPNGDKITLFHLLTHTSGIPSYDFEKAMGKPQELETILSWIRELTPLFDPGEGFMYSNSGFVILAKIIERVSGLSYEDFIRDNIFIPCDMSDSGFYSMAESIPDMAQGYTKQPYAPRTILAPPAPLGGKGAGDIYSTVLDLCKLGSAVLKGDLLSEDSWRRAFQPFKEGWGLAWRVEPILGENEIHHGGGASGFMSEFRILKDKGLIIIALFNNDFLLAKSLETRFAAIALGKPWEEPIYKDYAAVSESFKNYLGDYPLDDGVKQWSFKLTADDNHLYFQEAGRPICIAYPISQNSIYIKDANYRINFRKTEEGTVSYEAVLDLKGGMIIGERKQPGEKGSDV